MNNNNGNLKSNIQWAKKKLTVKPTILCPPQKVYFKNENKTNTFSENQNEENLLLKENVKDELQVQRQQSQMEGLQSRKNEE